MSDLVSQPNLKEIRGDDHAFLRLKTYTETEPINGELTVVDLFSGCGGISVGIREACRALRMKFSPCLAVDFLAAACDCYAHNFPGATVLNTDIADVLTLDFEKRPRQKERKLLDSLPSIDLLVGGPPCQGHSDLNNFTRRDDPKNQLYLYMLRAAELLRPTHLVIENVIGAAHDKGHVVQIVCQRLEKLGYKVALGGVYVPDIGVPQKRKRLLIVASKQTTFSFEKLTATYALPIRSVRWAISDLERVSSSSLFETTARPSKDNARRIQYLFDNNLFDLPNSERPHCHRDKVHSYTSVYGRLQWDMPSQTITSGFCNMSMGRYVHPSLPRTLTPHEAARLQFFPDYFDFSSAQTRSDLTTLIGNAVPPKLSYLLGLELIGVSTLKRGRS